jgi:hypothetical protein
MNFAKNFSGNRVGFVIEAMEYFIAYENLRPKIREFVEPYVDIDVKVVARKAKKILRKF